MLSGKGVKRDIRGRSDITTSVDVMGACGLPGGSNWHQR